MIAPIVLALDDRLCIADDIDSATLTKAPTRPKSGDAAERVNDFDPTFCLI